MGKSKQVIGGKAIVLAIAVALGGGIAWKTFWQADAERGRSPQTAARALPNIDNVTSTLRFNARRSPKGYSKGEVQSIAFSPDGNTLFSASGYRVMKLWDRETGKELVTAEESTPLSNQISNLRFSPDGATFVASVAAHKRDSSSAEDLAIARLWDARTGEILRTFEGQHRLIEEVSFSPDGSTILVVSPYGVVELWDVATGKLRRTLELCDPKNCIKTSDAAPNGNDGHIDFVKDASFSPDGRTILSASDDGTVKVWDVQTGELVRTFGEYSKRGLEDGVRAARFSPNGSTIMDTNGQRVRLWNVQTGERLYLEEGRKLSTLPATFNSDGTIVAIARDDFPSRIKILDAKTGEMLRTFEAEEQTIASLAFSPDGDALAIGNIGGVVSLWNPETGEKLRTLLNWGESRVDAVAFSPDGNALAIGQGKAVRLWNVVTGEELSTISGHTETVASVAFSPDDKTIISSTGEYAKYATPKIWDAVTGRELQRIEGKADVPLNQGTNTNSNIVADESLIREEGKEVFYNAAVLKDVNSRKTLRTFKRHSVNVTNTALNLAGSLVAAIHEDGVVKVWDAQTGAEVYHLQHKESSKFAEVNFSADGKLLASSSYRLITLWDVETGEELRTLENAGFIDSGRAIFSPDGKMLAAFSEGTIKIWDVETGRVRGFIDAPDGDSGGIGDAQFNSDGTAIAAGYEDGSVKAWDLRRDRIQRLLDRARVRVSEASGL
ncbi:MAG: WD40 repeat domain-containing protein [Cyanobacteria bacterium P01_D01_bin.73]